MVSLVKILGVVLVAVMPGGFIVLLGLALARAVRQAWQAPPGTAPGLRVRRALVSVHGPDLRRPEQVHP